MKTHNITRDSKGQGMDKSITPICSCGWKGYAEEAHNDYMYTNLIEQEEKHSKDSLVEDKEYLAEQSKRW